MEPFGALVKMVGAFSYGTRSILGQVLDDGAIPLGIPSGFLGSRRRNLQGFGIHLRAHIRDALAGIIDPNAFADPKFPQDNSPAI
jgi:hypothetical protein